MEAEVRMNALKMEEGGMSQGMLAAPRTWENENRFSPKVSRRDAALQTT